MHFPGSSGSFIFCFPLSLCLSVYVSPPGPDDTNWSSMVTDLATDTGQVGISTFWLLMELFNSFKIFGILV